MARMRSVKPEFWSDQDLAHLSRDTRLLYIGLWNLADEHSRLRGDPRYVKGQLFPYDDDLTPDDIDKMLCRLADDGKAVRYTISGAAYLFLPNLARHQRLETDKVPSRLPGPPDADEPEPVSPSRANLSAPDADELSLKHVAGSREHVAGSREHVGLRGRVRADPTRADADFDRFWQTYPRREAKAAARKAWDKAIGSVDPDRVLAGAERYRDDPNRDPKFTKHAATWLNAACWDDDPLPTRSRASPNGYVERNGLRLKPETAQRLDDRSRWEALDAANAQTAIKGPS